jgi:hypothetical protein
MAIQARRSTRVNGLHSGQWRWAIAWVVSM